MSSPLDFSPITFESFSAGGMRAFTYMCMPQPFLLA